MVRKMKTGIKTLKYMLYSRHKIYKNSALTDLWENSEAGRF